MRVLRKGSDKSKEIAYKSLVRPVMEYGAACWDPYRLEHIKTMGKIKKRALKYCRKNSPLKWETLKDRRTRIRLCALFKTYRGEPAWREIKNRLQPPNYSSRNDHSYKLRERRQRTDTGKFSFLNRTIRDWNALPADLLKALPTTKNSLMLAGSEFQSLGRAIVKEDEYEEVRWDGIVSIVSWREPGVTETLGHVLGFCRKGELLRNNRHHKVRGAIACLLRNKGWEVHEEVHCISEDDSHRRADIIAINRQQQKAIIIDRTIRMERDLNQAHQVDQEKRAIYEPCIPYLSAKYNIPLFNCSCDLNVLFDRHLSAVCITHGVGEETLTFIDVQNGESASGHELSILREG
ncbi:hypothetical protein ANN_12321 [Periplaneta americana]|uniref:Endonuclease-reverse transcriptase n=1 Tax=Periplaneta americana TaxID=6978 RepID=A0ABQ8TIC1_PERAM|nr:hypothetical protein ANN_12321 [Periplaneta americana]